MTAWIVRGGILCLFIWFNHSIFPLGTLFRTSLEKCDSWKKITGNIFVPPIIHNLYFHFILRIFKKAPAPGRSSIPNSAATAISPSCGEQPCVVKHRWPTLLARYGWWEEKKWYTLPKI